MSLPLGNLSVTYIHLLIKVLNDLDVDYQPLENQFKITQILNNQDGRLSIPKFMRIGKAAIDLTGRKDLGLLMGQQCSISYLDLTGYAAMTAKTILDAQQILTRFEPILSFNRRGQSKLNLDQDYSYLTFYSIPPYNEYNQFVVDLVLSSYRYLTDWIAGTEIKPIRVGIEFPEPSYVDAYKDHFPCPIEFGAETNNLKYHRTNLELETAYHNPITFRSAIDACHRRLEETKVHESEIDQLRQILNPMIQGYSPTLEEFAQAIGVPPWTLKRRLKTMGTHYKALLDETKKELAISYVRDTDLSFGEIAWRLGFSNPTGFQRAFNRWTGKPPGAYRLSS